MLKCENRLSKLLETDICYMADDPTEPAVVTKIRIEQNPALYKLYPEETTSSSLPSPLPSPLP
jgi:hypothetical protein